MNQALELQFSSCFVSFRKPIITRRLDFFYRHLPARLIQVLLIHALSLIQRIHYQPHDKLLIPARATPVNSVTSHNQPSGCLSLILAANSLCGRNRTRAVSRKCAELMRQKPLHSGKKVKRVSVIYHIYFSSSVTRATGSKHLIWTKNKLRSFIVDDSSMSNHLFFMAFRIESHFPPGEEGCLLKRS